MFKDTGKYGCSYQFCKKHYNKTDAVRKHAKKHHPEWIKNKKPIEYSFYIPKEYKGDDYVKDYMIMIRNIFSTPDEVINIDTNIFTPPITIELINCKILRDLEQID